MKMKKGLLLMIVGGALLLGAFGLTGYNLWDESRAEASVLTVMDELVKELPEETKELHYSTTPPSQLPAYALFPKKELPETVVEEKSYIGVLEVPVLGLSLPVLSEWSYPNLKTAPCRFNGSPYTDDLVICGHNYKTHFGPLMRLLAGDEILFTDMDGNLFRYEVVETEILQPAAVAEMLDEEWDLSLFTCTYGGRTRFTVRCLRIEE